MSTSLPWEAEYELTAEQVSNIVSKNTKIDVASVGFIGAGWDFFNWLVNEELVFRFPKRHTDIDTLVHERDILRNLKMTLATPQIEYWIPRPAGFHKPFLGYRYIPGTPLIHKSSTQCDIRAIGIALGTALTELHQQKLTRPLVPVDPITLWQGEFPRLLQDAKEDLARETLEAVDDALKSYKNRHRTSDQVTTHNDLGVEHILVDNELRVVALIDWADAATANRFVDFAGIWAWGGDQALAATLTTYFIEPTTEDLGQIRVHGLCYALEQIYYGRRINDQSLNQTARDYINERVNQGEVEDIYAHL